MLSRFRIEEMVAQDASGVVFQAIDLETNQWVALRRFFPFGLNGGGLNPEEQAKYLAGVTYFSSIDHRALRGVIAGGCDPFDGVPFLVTEWVEGRTIENYLLDGPLSPKDAIHMVSQAIDLSIQISEILGKEDIWIETTVRTMIACMEDCGRGVTFWLSPLKWIGHRDCQRGLAPLVRLMEESMGWSGKSVLDHEGEGIGAWVNWLRGASQTASLAEALERLQEIAELKPLKDAPEALRRVPQMAVSPVKRKTGAVKRKSGVGNVKRKSGVPYAILIVVCLTSLGLVTLGLFHLKEFQAMNGSWVDAMRLPGFAVLYRAKSGETKPVQTNDEVFEDQDPVSEPRFSREKSAEEISRDAENFLLQVQNKAAENESKSLKIANQKDVFTVEDSELLLTMSGTDVAIEGILQGLDFSSSGKTLYLQFSETPARLDVRGAIMTSKAPEDLAQAKLIPLIGKNIRVKGKVKTEPNGSARRPTVTISSRADIQVMQ